MNPSCQIVPVVNLSSEIYQLNKDNSNIKKEITTLNATIKLLTNENTSLKGEIATLKGEITSLKEENLLLKEEIKGNKLIFDYQISQFNLKWKEKFGEEIIQKEDERYLQIEIENSFKEKMSPITKKMN
jgi:chromosome segregation ATPase